MDESGNPDFADKVYNAAKLANRYSPYDLNEMVVNSPYYVIGEYAYVLEDYDQIAMFPYKMDEKNMQHGAVQTRPHWMEGVIIDNQLILDNPDMFDKGGKSGHSGFPYYRVLSILQDIANLQDIFGQLSIKYVTG